MAKDRTALTAPLVTALNGLAAAAWWVSPVIDDDANLAFALEIAITLKTSATAGSDGNFNVYFAGSVPATPSYAGGVGSNSDATWTPVGDDISNLKPIGSIKYTSETTVRTSIKRFLISDVPRDAKLVIYNGSGAVLGSADCSVELNTVKY